MFGQLRLLQHATQWLGIIGGFAGCAVICDGALGCWRAGGGTLLMTGASASFLGTMSNALEGWEGSEPVALSSEALLLLPGRGASAAVLPLINSAARVESRAGQGAKHRSCEHHAGGCNEHKGGHMKGFVAWHVLSCRL